MPIKDRKRRRLVRLGVIRLGHKETRKRDNGSEYSFPVQDDHFVLTDAPEIITIYGNEPRELDVMLPFPDIGRNFDAYYQVWASGVLLCQGDGEYVQYAAPVNVIKDKGKERLRAGEGETLVNNGTACVPFDWNGDHFETGETVPCPGADANLYPHCQFCKLSALLKVMMARPELFRMGYYQIVTGSGRNYDTIMGTLEAMPADKLSGIPFKLRLVKEATTYTEKGKRHATEKWFIQLEPDPEYTRELYARAAARQIGQGDPEPPPAQLVDSTEEYTVEGVYENGNPETIIGEDEPPFDIENPTFENWDDFRAKCVKYLKFDDDAQARVAFGLLYPANVKRPSMLDAWSAMYEYQDSKGVFTEPPADELEF